MTHPNETTKPRKGAQFELKPDQTVKQLFDEKPALSVLVLVAVMTKAMPSLWPSMSG